MIYEIKMHGHIDKHWFEGMDISYTDDDTVLVGEIADQSALHGVLKKVRDLGATLISVNCTVCSICAF